MHSTPPTNTSSGLAIQQRQRERALRRLAKLRKKATAEIERLIGFLDASDDYVMTELEENDDRELVGDDEPSLGSFDRITNQEKSWRGGITGLDAEQDDCDSEDADPDECKLQPAVMS